jgi:hypothetical protein
MTDIDPRVQLAYEESVRGLDMQSDTLNALRSQTGVLIAATTVASAFLGAAALERHHVTYWANIAALILFGLVIVLCLCVLWPSDDWAFVYSATTLDETYYQKDVDATQSCRSMAIGNAAHRDTNKSKLKWRFGFFRFACIGLTADMILWLVSIGVR